MSKIARNQFISTVTLFLTLAASGFAVTPEKSPAFEWAVAAGGLKNEKARCVAVDKVGNILLTGEATDEVKFGEIALKGAGGIDCFVAKLDPTGKFLWARLGGGGLIDRGYAVTVDMEGNCYVTGSYQSTDADFSGTKLPSRGDYDLFVAKYDRDGKLVWIETAGGNGYDYGHAIAVDSAGDIVVAGAVVGDADFGPVQIANEAGSHPFCAKYHPDGKLVWAKAATGRATGGYDGVAVDGQGNIYLGGDTTGIGKFGGLPLVTGKGMSAVVVKLSPQGEVTWIAQQWGNPSCLFHEITCDRDGSVWASGMFKGTAVLNGETFTTADEKDSDAFLSHFNTDGKLLWSRVGQGSGLGYGLGVATDGKGNCYLTGEFVGGFQLGGETLESRGATDVFAAKFNERGVLRWIVQGGGEKGESGYSVAADPAGSVFMAGAFAGSAQFGDLTITSAGSMDLYAAKVKAK